MKVGRGRMLMLEEFQVRVNKVLDEAEGRRGVVVHVSAVVRKAVELTAVTTSDYS
jgi:hypothetical protein